MPDWLIIVLVVVLAVGLIYGPIQTLRSINARDRRNNLKLWAHDLRATKPISIEIEGDNAIILDYDGDKRVHVVKHVFANVNMVTVTRKVETTRGLPDAVLLYNKMVKEGLNGPDRVDGAHQYDRTYTPPKKRK